MCVRCVVVCVGWVVVCVLGGWVGGGVCVLGECVVVVVV